MKFIKKKNLRRYEESYQWISHDSFERIQNYLQLHPLKTSQLEKLRTAIQKNQKIRYKYLKIVLDIIPESTPRPRLGQFRFYVSNSHDNNAFTELMVKSKKDLYHYITTPCKFIVHNYFPIPNSFSRLETILAELNQIEMISRPDWDNLGKTYSDMIQKWILMDDALIIDGESHKHYSLKPRVEITIQYQETFKSKRMKRQVEQSTSYLKGVEFYENQTSKKE